MNKSADKWPCVFRGNFIREVIDPQVQADFVRKLNKKAPFGDLRRAWRNKHCSELNPYDSFHCPYSEVQCAQAFLGAVFVTTAAVQRPQSAMGYFSKVAFTSALDRADRKPLAREAEPTQDPSDARAADSGDEEGQRLRGRRARPESLGALLGALDLGPRQGPAQDGREGGGR